MEPDPGLWRVIGWFASQDDLQGRFGTAIRQAFDEVFDGQRTGRYSLAQLSKVEKTYVGTKIEIVVQAEFGLQRGLHMDFLVDGEEVDAKWSMKSGGWMIPTEAVGHLCLCITADDALSLFSVGLVRVEESNLGTSANKDGKRRLNDLGISSVSWVVDSGELPENLLLRLEPEIRSQILDAALSGQRRVNQLFRLVQRRLVRREVVLTVARQDDGPKRVRDARNHLRQEGILILGHQKSHPAIANRLGLPPPPKGSWVSVRVVRSRPDLPGVVQLDGEWWRSALARDPVEPGPRNYE